MIHLDALEFALAENVCHVLEECRRDPIEQISVILSKLAFKILLQIFEAVSRQLALERSHHLSCSLALPRTHDHLKHPERLLTYLLVLQMEAFVKVVDNAGRQLVC